MQIDKLYDSRFQDNKSRVMIWKVLVRDFFQKFIRPTDTVLDIGCGYGEFINEVKAKHKFAIDVSSRFKKSLHKNVRFFSMSATKMTKIKSNFITVVFVSNVFEHMLRNDIIETIQELRRVLKKGGKALVLQPNIRFLSRDYWMFFDHLTPVDDRALEEIFSVYGFRLQKRILKFLPYTTKSKLPQNDFFVRLYLRLPFLWRIFGKQSFLVFEKN